MTLRIGLKAHQHKAQAFRPGIPMALISALKGRQQPNRGRQIAGDLSGRFFLTALTQP